MADQPYQGTDPVILKINALLNDVVAGVLVRAVEADIIAAQPWMGLPIWKQIWQFFFELSVSKFYDRAKVFLFGKLTDAQVAAQTAAAVSATEALKQEISKPTEEQDSAKIKKELDDFDAAMERLITFPRPS